MKKSLFFISSLFFLLSCTEETPKAHLLEYKISGQLYSYEGFAHLYHDYVNNVKKGYDWHIYNLGMSALYIQVYDSTFTKDVFDYPAFQAEFKVEMADGNSKTYQAAGGQIRFLGNEMGEILGDFHFKMKNIHNPFDSLMINEGYFRIYQEQRDRIFKK